MAGRGGHKDHDLAQLLVLRHGAKEPFFPNIADPCGKQLLIDNSPFNLIGAPSHATAGSGGDVSGVGRGWECVETLSAVVIRRD